MKKPFFILLSVSLFAFGGFTGYALATLPVAKIIFAVFCMIGMCVTFLALLWLIYKKDPDKPTYPKPETWSKPKE